MIDRALCMGLLLPLAISPLAAQAEVVTRGYLCDRGVAVPATYVNSDGSSVAVLHVEGRQITLMATPSASGARYVWPSDGSGYVWWTKGEAATLYWRDGASGTETPLLQNCRAAP